MVKIRAYSVPDAWVLFIIEFLSSSNLLWSFSLLYRTHTHDVEQQRHQNHANEVHALIPLNAKYSMWINCDESGWRRNRTLFSSIATQPVSCVQHHHLSIGNKSSASLISGSTLTVMRSAVSTSPRRRCHYSSSHNDDIVEQRANAGSINECTLRHSTLEYGAFGAYNFLHIINITWMYFIGIKILYHVMWKIFVYASNNITFIIIMYSHCWWCIQHPAMRRSDLITSSRRSLASCVHAIFFSDARHFNCSEHFMMIYAERGVRVSEVVSVQLHT